MLRTALTFPTTLPTAYQRPLKFDIFNRKLITYINGL